MELVLKKIYLKEEIERDIEVGNYDTDKFVEYIKTHLDKANFLLENKILDLDSDVLYNALKEVFDLKYDNYDYLEILSKKYNKNYTRVERFTTNVIDDEGYNIEFIGAVPRNFPNYNGKVKFEVLRDAANSLDFILFKEVKHKLNERPKFSEQYENINYTNFNTSFDENNELFDEVLDLVRRTVKDKGVLKQVLGDLKKYVDNLMYQAKGIVKLSEDENPQVRQIGLLYKKAFESNFNKNTLTQKNNHKRRY